MRKKIKLKSKHLFFILLVVIILFLIFFLWENYVVLGKNQIYTSFIASENIGFDLNPDSLTFGKINPGQSGKRDLAIKNDFDIPAKVSIKSKGSISKYLIVSENDFYLGPGEEKNVSFTVSLPEDLALKKYDGFINIFLKRF